MAKNTKKGKKEISMTPLMYMGFIIVCVTALLQRNILYLVGVLALVVYMIQVAFEKRTGKREAGGENIENGIKKRK